MKAPNVNITKYLLVIGLCASTYGATFNLTCVLSASACAAAPSSYGTVVVLDIPGGVSVTVTTTGAFSYQNLMFNSNASPTLTAPAVYQSNAFSLSPYNGRFDVGRNPLPPPVTGFDGNSGATFNILGTGFSAANFITLDSLSLVHLALQIRVPELDDDCAQPTCAVLQTSGDADDDLITVGGIWAPDAPPGDDPVGEVPEPASIGITLAALAATRKRL